MEKGWERSSCYPLKNTFLLLFLLPVRQCSVTRAPRSRRPTGPRWTFLSWAASRTARRTSSLRYVDSRTCPCVVCCVRCCRVRERGWGGLDGIVNGSDVALSKPRFHLLCTPHAGYLSGNL